MERVVSCLIRCEMGPKYKFIYVIGKNESWEVNNELKFRGEMVYLATQKLQLHFLANILMWVDMLK